MNLVLKVEGRRDEGTSNDRHGTSWSSVRGFSDWRQADGVFIDRGSKDPHDIVASGGKRLAKLWMRTPRAGVDVQQNEQLRQSALWIIFSGRIPVK
jgi:hypothetical protein